MKPKEQRRINRENRRLEWQSLRAEFLLIGGHKDWLVPFGHSWRITFHQQIASINNGDPYFTKPRGFHHGYSGTTTGRIASNTPSGQSLPRDPGKSWLPAIQAAYRK